MTPSEVIDVLRAWTPYMAEGFAWNMLLSVTTMLIGTPIGLALACMRASSRRVVSRTGNLGTGLARNVPTFTIPQRGFGGGLGLWKRKKAACFGDCVA